MKLLKELFWSLLVVLVLYTSYALAPFLALPQTKTAQVPVFQNQAFYFSVLPLQVVQSWVLEQQLESKDVAVQEALKQMSLHFKTERNATLADFHFDLQGALAYYLIENPQKPFSCIFIPGSGQKEGWLSAKYYGVQQGIFFFTEVLQARQRNFFEKSLLKMRFQTKKFEARKHHFELKGQPYTLLWEEHAFALELPKEVKQQTLMLAPNGFHLSCPLALSNLPASFHFLESIKASSLNYYGAQLNNKQALVLDFEALLTFDNLKARAAFLNSCQNAFPDWQWAPNFVRVNEALYALKKEGNKQLYICSKPKQHIQNGTFAHRTSTLPIACSGNPTLLTKLDNAGWAAAILELFPIYRGISDFSARTAKVSTTNNTIRWELKKEYFAAGEFLKLLSTTTAQ
ncbi:MAG: hypothetical protein K9J18_08520 [Crocinitomicaceae bacterium]|nr:hypothetical protein [Crocinitomicaceae bacterium]